MIHWGAVQDESGEWTLSAEPIEAEPAKPIPELPAECWNATPVDVERAHQATLAMCRGGGMYFNVPGTAKGEK